MRRIYLIAAIFAVVFLLPPSVRFVVSQDSDPESVIRGFHEALSAWDIDTAMSYYADDIVFAALPPPPGSEAVIIGKEQNRADWELAPARNFSYEITELEVLGNKVAWTAEVQDDVFRELGVNPGTFDVVSIVQNGLIIAETWAMSEEFLDRFMAAASFQEAVGTVNEAFLTAVSEGDVAGMSAVYTKEGQALPPNGSTVTGSDAIQAMWQEALDMGITSATLETVERENYGDIAYEVGTYTMLREGDGVIDEGKYIIIWKREDGQWKWHRNIWNTSRPLDN
jgi:ketosteroid isomerase-like protein